ncbi:sugar ABC transporter ATP-binding protein [Patescibacteria group bacterium]|nr:sugar ABC transporter ATP-binding protein [Patescibacteria group bacterium]
MKKISKSFGMVKALQEVDLNLYYNEVLGLVGDNAAGKSTLVKILSGVYAPNEGEIFMEGEKVRFTSPADSRKLGIEMIYQDLALVPNLSIAGNIFLGKELVKNLLGMKILNRKKMFEKSWQTMAKLGIDIESTRIKSEALSGGQRQAVAVSRAIFFKPRVIIMDEPTAALSVKGIKKVLELIKELREREVSIIFISHRLPNIFTVTDRIIILRAGRRVGDRITKDTTPEEIIELMVGISQTNGS